MSVELNNSAALAQLSMSIRTWPPTSHAAKHGPLTSALSTLSYRSSPAPHQPPDDRLLRATLPPLSGSGGDPETGHSFSHGTAQAKFCGLRLSGLLVHLVPRHIVPTMVGIDEHLRAVLARHRVDTGLFSPVRSVQPLIEPVIRKWGGPFIVDIRTSGSFAKGTAVHGGTDIDLFVSLTSTLTDTLQQISDTLFNAFSQAGYATRRQNVSIGLTVNGWKVDVTPSRRQDQRGNYHSLWSTKTASWLQTNISEHIRVVSNSGRLDEIRLIKIWRNRFGIDWQSFYLELFVLDALRGARVGNVQENVVTVFRAITTSLATKRLIDPANTNNVVSNVLTAQGKSAVMKSAQSALESPWNVVFQ